MIVVGIDPGSVKHAWTALDVRGPHASWIRTGVIHDVESFEVVWRAHAPTLVVVERPVWIPMPRLFNGQALIDTSFAAGALNALASQRAATFTILMRDWRSFLCGRQKHGGQADDAMVKAALEGRIEGMPRTNAHARDAAGAALVGALLYQDRARKVASAGGAA